MAEDTETDDEPAPFEAVAVGAALLVGFGIAALLLALEVEAWWIGFPMIGGLVPLAVGLAQWYEARTDGDDAETDETADALERLRERYAEGELTEAEFERRLERLLETESVETARRSVDRAEETGDERGASARETVHERE